MDELNEKELGEATLDRVTGGWPEFEGKTAKGIYRCSVCGWELPKETPLNPHMRPCKKCGGKMVWHKIYNDV